MSLRRQFRSFRNTIRRLNARTDPPILSNLEPNTLVNGSAASVMALAFKYGQMVHGMKGNGKITEHMGRVSSFT